MRLSLETEVLNKSEEKEDLHTAVQEWDIIHHYNQKRICVCGQDPIIECSKIRNRINGNIIDPIGNECIEHFHDKNLNEQLTIRKKKDIKMKGRYKGLTFEDVIRIDPRYIPTTKEVEKHKTLIKYTEYRNELLKEWDKALEIIRPYVRNAYWKRYYHQCCNFRYCRSMIKKKEDYCIYCRNNINYLNLIRDNGKGKWLWNKNTGETYSGKLEHLIQSNKLEGFLKWGEKQETGPILHFVPYARKIHEFIHNHPYLQK